MIGIVAAEFFGDSYVDYSISGRESEILVDFLLEFDLRVAEAGQKAIIVFMSNTVPMMVDYFTIGLRQGKLEMQMNLGSGDNGSTDRTELDVDRWYHISVNRTTRDAVLSVDGVETFSLFVRGEFDSLNVQRHFYAGGVPSTIRSAVYTMTQFESGLIGCIDNITLTGTTSIGNIINDDAPDGANVGSCFAHPCDSSRCANGGTCVPDGANFHCECRAGVFGPLCGDLVDPCASSPCAAGSTCVSTTTSFRCACGLLQAGPRCEDGIHVSLRSQKKVVE